MKDTLVTHVKEVSNGLTGVLGTSVTVAGILEIVHLAIGITAGIFTIIYMFYMGKKIRMDLRERRKKNQNK